MTAARRRFGRLAATSLLLHGWLPVVLAAPTTDAGDVPICSAPTVAPAASPRSGHGPECPFSHGPICLCGLFAQVLGPEPAPMPAPPSATGSARQRRPTRISVRSRPGPLFEARAPPVLD